MSFTTKNIIEINDLLQKIRVKRKQHAKFFYGLGPPDMCFLEKRYKKSFNYSFSKSKKACYYFYPYGVDTSSPAAVSVFLKNLIQEQEPNKG